MRLPIVVISCLYFLCSFLIAEDFVGVRGNPIVVTKDWDDNLTHIELASMGQVSVLPSSDGKFHLNCSTNDSVVVSIVQENNVWQLTAKVISTGTKVSVGVKHVYQLNVGAGAVVNGQTAPVELTTLLEVPEYFLSNVITQQDPARETDEIVQKKIEMRAILKNARAKERELPKKTKAVSDPDPMALHKDSKGRTFLHKAVLARSEITTKMWLNLGADIDAKDNKGQTPLGLAAKAFDFKMVEFLLGRGAHVNGRLIKDLRPNASAK